MTTDLAMQISDSSEAQGFVQTLIEEYDSIFPGPPPDLRHPQALDASDDDDDDTVVMAKQPVKTAPSLPGRPHPPTRVDAEEGPKMVRHRPLPSPPSSNITPEPVVPARPIGFRPGEPGLSAAHVRLTDKKPNTPLPPFNRNKIDA